MARAVRKSSQKDTTAKTVNSSTTRKTKSKPVVKTNIHRSLCFTNFNQDIAGLLLYILEIQSQTYKENIDYIINITVNNKKQENTYKNITSKYIENTNIKLVFCHNNTDDELSVLRHLKKQQYNTFIYCDSLFNYQHNHIENLINLYNEKSSDVLQIACANIVDNDMNLIKSKEKKYNFIFNNKALDILLQSKNKNLLSWTNEWSEHKIKIRQIGNITTLYLIEKQDMIDGMPNNEAHTNHEEEQEDYYNVLENDHFSICIFEHNYWSSYVYLNKRNNRMYNIMNDDHGAFDIVDDRQIRITWDTWGDEIFYKKYSGKNYHYSVNE